MKIPALAALIGLSVCCAPAAAQTVFTDQVRIVHAEPKEAKHQPIRQTLQERRILELLRALLSPLRLPRPLTLEVKGCDGSVDAYYSKGTATLCYEYIELIEQHDDGPSVYRDTWPKGSAGGYHHLCYWAEGSLEAEVEHFARHGIEAGYLASFGPLNFGYFDARAQLGCFIEVLEREPGTVALFQSIADAAVDWDGSDPLRVVG